MIVFFKCLFQKNNVVDIEIESKKKIEISSKTKCALFK